MSNSAAAPACILVVEDDHDLRDVLCEVLSKSGYTVEAAAEGRAGLAILRSGAVDLLITDLIMPGVEGIETIVTARKEFPHLPILAISGAGPATTYLALAQKLGANRSLRKPFELEVLLETVRDVLSKGPAASGAAAR